MTYLDAIKKIIKDYIKSAIYIDENAREPFSSINNPELFEEKLSVDLYKEFANHNIQLTTFKYNELKYNQQKRNLLNRRDFVLLDWKLDGEAGEDKALNILSDIFESNPQISFCGVYTKEQPNVVFQNILSYFSGITNVDCENIKLQLLLEDEDNSQAFLSTLNEIVLCDCFEDSKLDDLRRDYSNIIDNEFFYGADNKELKKKLLECWCAYSNYIKSDFKQVQFISYKFSDKILLINNTFVVILNKTATKFDRILNRLTKLIADYSNGFSLLMCMEMNNIIQNNGMAMNTGIKNISHDLFAFHKSLDKNGFDAFIKEVMLNGVSLSLVDQQLSTIKSLQKPTKAYEPKLDELLSINTFYNSIQRSSETDLIFGDVFRHENDEGGSIFYICITPLCDCANPKNENTFYFAKGYQVTEHSKIKKLIKQSEELFISFLPDNTVIKWTNSTSDKDKPLYITPIPLTIPKPTIKDNLIHAYQLKSKVSQKEKLDLHYIGTVKQNYTQRIANHAFMHSIRVGISFASLLK